MDVMSRTARHGPTSGGLICQMRKTEFMVRLEDGVPVWQGQFDQGEKTDQVEKRAKVEEIAQVQVEKMFVCT